MCPIMETHEAGHVLAEAHSAARQAVADAFEAGVAEGLRRARGEEHREMSEVLDLSAYTFDDALL